MDGLIFEGNTSIDESMLTGESMPVDKNICDFVIGLSINKNGYIKFKATKVGKDTTLSQIIRLVKVAQGKKAPIAKLADIVSGKFVPIVIGISLISALLWLISGSQIQFSINIFISVLVIACPCALGLATPIGIMVGTGKGAQNGVLFKSGEALETLHNVKIVAFDKTGTITEGKPVVTDIIPFNGHTREDIIAFAASAETGSEHPIAEAIITFSKEEKINIQKMNNFTSLSGKGIITEVSERKVFLGNLKIMNENIIVTKDIIENGKLLSG